MKMIAYICIFTTQIFEHKLNTRNEKRYMLFEKKTNHYLLLNWLKVIFLMLLFTPHTTPLSAQNNDISIDPQFDEIKKKLRTTIDYHLAKNYIDQSSPNLGLLNHLYNLNKDVSVIDLNTRLFAAEKRKVGKDKGFRLIGSYTDNFNAGEPDETGYVYKKSIQGGLEWNMLNGGWKDHKLDVHQYKLNSQINTILNDKQLRNNNATELSNNIVTIFNRYKIQKLNDLLMLLNKQVEVTKKIYYLKYISWEEVSELLTKKAQVETMLKNYNSQIIPSTFDTLDPIKLPIVDVDLDKLIAVYKSTQKNDTLSALRSKNAEYQNRTVREIGLKSSLKYNYFDSRLSLPDRKFASLGVSLSIPFPLQNHVNKQLTRIQKEDFTFESTEQKDHELNILYSRYNDYKSKLKQYLEVYQIRSLLQNKIRIEANKEAVDDPSYSPIRIVAMIGDLLSKDLDLIDDEQAAYLSLLQLYNTLPGGSITQFLVPVNLDEFIPKRNADRILYIWYPTFRDNDNAFIYQYLKNNEVKGVMLSIGENLELKAKAEEFIKLLKVDNIGVQLIFTGKELLDPQKPTNLVNALNAASKVAGIKGVHLDIDISNFPDYVASKQRYAEYYINMVRIAQVYLKDKNLKTTVSLPLTYDSGKLDSVFSVADKIYLFANDNKEETFIKGKIQSKFAREKDKIVIVLRTSNFYDRFAFEDYIERLSKSIKINNFAINDLKGLLLLEERIFNKIEK